ncbi:hypothetical protein GOBAR_DD25346 [Gossypium barbadense]|nr:hypothetical protein GOBAR_DD25346 [Gossypium barbadense]
MSYNSRSLEFVKLLLDYEKHESIYVGVANLGLQEVRQRPMSTILLRVMVDMVLQKSIYSREENHNRKGFTYNSKTFSSASGLVGRDLRGNIKVLKTVIHRNVPSSFAAEAYACLDGAKLRILLRIQSVITGAIIRDIQNKKADFQELIFQYTHRSENMDAHRLAKNALEKGENTYLRGVDLESHAFASAGIWSKKSRLMKCFTGKEIKTDSRSDILMLGGLLLMER